MIKDRQSQGEVGFVLKKERGKQTAIKKKRKKERRIERERTEDE